MKAQASINRLFVAVAVSWLLAISAQAQPPGGMPMLGPMPPLHGIGFGDLLPPFLHGVILTDEQRNKIFLIQYAQLPAIREKSASARKAHEDLRAMVTSNSYDEVKAKALADSSARAMADLALLRAFADHQIHALLTAEQHAHVEKLLTVVRECRVVFPPLAPPLR